MCVISLEVGVDGFFIQPAFYFYTGLRSVFSVKKITAWNMMAGRGAKKEDTIGFTVRAGNHRELWKKAHPTGLRWNSVYMGLISHGQKAQKIVGTTSSSHTPNLAQILERREESSEDSLLLVF